MPGRPPAVLVLTLAAMLSACCCGPAAAATASGDSESVRPGRTLQQGQALPTSADVIVIGAGVAGLAAARQLVDQKRGSVVVLEARTRVGGRRVGGSGPRLVAAGGRPPCMLVCRLPGSP